MAASPLPPLRTPNGVPGNRPARGPGWAQFVLRAPLFWKLLLPQLALVAILLGGFAATLPTLTSHRGVLVLVLVGGPVLTITLSAWILRVALRPIHDLTETGVRVAHGDWSARAPESPFADRRVERLGAVLNEMLDALGEARMAQRKMSRQVLEGEEREREHIAHELYAGTAQTLAGVLIRLRVLRMALHDGDPDPVLDEVVSEVRQALEEVRAVARRLRPPELDELGVRAALEAHARPLSAAWDTPVHFHGVIPEDRLDAGARLALFRIVQEAVTNAVVHAGATAVDVRFSDRGEWFRTEVSDDGAGFDADEGLGLVGMRERADYVLGRLAVQSSLGQGTCIRFDLPWSPPDELAEPTSSPRLNVKLAHG